MKSNKDLTWVEFEVAQAIKRAMNYIELEDIESSRIALKYALVELYRE